MHVSADSLKVVYKIFQFLFSGNIFGNRQSTSQVLEEIVPILRYRQFKIILLPKILTGSKIRLVGQAGFGFGLSRVIQVFPVEKDCLVTFPIFRNAS